MPRRFRRQANSVDSDQIGRMGGSRRKERSVNSELARRLRRFKGQRGKYLSGGSAGRRNAPAGCRQDAASAGTSPARRGEVWRAMSRYLGRESASADGKHGVFYDAAREGVDAKQEAVQWAQDRHHFRLIVSPERGGDIPDMTSYIREVMRRVERDLDTKLQWIAVNHHNTDNPHAHVLLRGKQPDGADLVIPRQYISYGIRDRASDVATELLGERTPRRKCNWPSPRRWKRSGSPRWTG